MSILSNNPITLEIKAILAIVSVVVVVSVLTYSGYWLYHKGYDSCEADHTKSELAVVREKAKENAKTDAEFNDADKKLNTSLDTNEKTVKIVTKIVEKEIEKPIYSSTIIPASGMHAIATSARTLNSTRVSGSSVSEVRPNTSTGQ